MRNDLKIPLVIFLSSWATLAYEVLLIRLFSISLWYHYAFMIISIAMLGFAASGVLLAIRPPDKPDQERIPLYSLLLSAAISLSYLMANQVPFDPVMLSWEKSQIFHIGLYYLILAAPFFCCGLIIATAFSAQSSKSGLFYGADLIGAGLGSLGILLLLGFCPPERTAFLLAATAALAPLAAGGGLIRLLALLLIVANLALFVGQPRFAELRVSPYKGLPAALRYPGSRHLKSYFSPFAVIDTFSGQAARFAPGLSLRYLEPLPEQIGISVDKGEVSAVTASSNPAALAFLDQLPAALPYSLGKAGRVLVLDPRGGLQLLLARRHGAGPLVAVESNPALLEVIRDDLGQFSGGIYTEQTWTGLGRSWLRKGQERFHIIDLSLQGLEAGGSFGIGEDYRFTVEAFKEYLGHLEQDGLLVLNLYIVPPPRTELRLLGTVVAALEELGIRDAAAHLAAVRSWGSICILVKKTPLSGKEIEAVRRFAHESWFDLVQLPGIRAEESNHFIRMPGNDYFTAFQSILKPGQRQAFSSGYIFDIAPVRDDRPFFHYYLKLDRIGAIYRAMGRKWSFFLEQGYLLPAVLLQALVISLILLVLPAFAGRAHTGPSRGAGWRFLPYFALLGAGFMIVEITLIQKCILPLENPSYATAAVLASLLVSSGLGSLLSQRFTLLRNPSVCAAIALLIMIYGLLLPAAAAALALFGLGQKMALIITLFFPLGLLMGTPFPSGLRLLGEENALLIPWAWVINGTFSVLAPLLAVMTAMQIGFSRVLLLGALAYFLAFLILALRNRIVR